MTKPRVLLQPRRARPFYSRHPWVYAGAVAAVEGEPADGDVVDLHSHTGQFVARGLYNSKSKIRVRLYSWSPDIDLDRNFFRTRLETAICLRGPILGLAGPRRACRLVFSEADGLSGCTVDRYDRWLAVQFTALGLAQRRDMLTELLAELVQPEGIYLRTERGIGQLEGLELQDSLLWGSVPAEPIEIEEAGLRFLVHLAEGQKTGFYLDQRDNRQAVARLAAGRRVLDAFCYTGGFGLHAARMGASTVHGVDVSEPALELARQNARLNGLENMTFLRADVFKHLDAAVAAGERYDLVVLDPPKFARAQCRRGGPARLSAFADIGAAFARSGRYSGHLLLLWTHNNGYADRPARPVGGRGATRCSGAGTPRPGGRPSGFRHLPRIQLPEMRHQQSSLRRRASESLPSLAQSG